MTRAGGGPRSLAALVPKLARPMIGKRGFAEAGLLADWRSIAGIEVANHCQPERLEFGRSERVDGTLHLRVEGAWALALQHLEPQLIERINGSLGYRAVGRLKFLQAPLPVPQGRTMPPDPTPAAEPDPASRAALAEQLAGIADENLRRAAESLGLAILARTARERQG